MNPFSSTSCPFGYVARQGSELTCLEFGIFGLFAGAPSRDNEVLRFLLVVCDSFGAISSTSAVFRSLDGVNGLILALDKTECNFDRKDFCFLATNINFGALTQERIELMGMKLGKRIILMKKSVFIRNFKVSQYSYVTTDTQVVRY
jgi:hypothetical protein